MVTLATGSRRTSTRAISKIGKCSAALLIAAIVGAAVQLQRGRYLLLFPVPQLLNPGGFNLWKPLTL